MKVYIVRHGETSSNHLKCYNTDFEDLSATGIYQAEMLREQITEINYDIIISSPLIRAKHTADIINIYHKEIVVDDRLHERYAGNLVGKPLTVTNRKEYWNYNATTQYGTSEDIKSFFARVSDFLNDLKTKDYKNVLVVAHSGVSKAFSAYFEGIGNGLFLDRGLHNCEIKEYEL